MYVFVTEGPDGSGKTTLAKSLASELGLLYKHGGMPPKGFRSNTAGYFSSMLDTAMVEGLAFGEGKGIVLDRFALSEHVYGPIYRGEDRLGAEGWATIRDRMNSLGVIQVLCHTPYGFAVGAWRDNAAQEMFPGDEARYRAVWERYRDFRVGHRQVVWDWTDHDTFSNASPAHGLRAVMGRLKW